MKFDYQGVLFACGADVPLAMPDGWEYHGGAVRAPEDDAHDARPYLLVCYRRVRTEAACT